MKSISAGLLAALGTAGHLVTVTRTDGTISRHTDVGDNAVVGGETYLGRPGCTVHSIAWETGPAPATIEVEIPVGDVSPITESDLRAGFYDQATVTVDIFSWGSPAEGSERLFTGYIGNIDYTDAGNVRLDIVGLWSLAVMLRIRTFSPECGTELGHPTWCKVDVLGQFTVPATVASVISPLAFTITHAEGRAVDNWFTRGAGKFDAAPAGGANFNRAFDVRKWTAATNRVDLWIPLPGVVSVGDTMLIHAGCQLTLEDCRDKFDNLLHFQGFPNLVDDPFGGLDVI